MGQALYRQYRPKSLAEVVGQEHITTTLLHALEQGKMAHAYLFTGPRGVGKTSIARILAHEINKLPYTDDSTHLDIIEIDAASNRRIDEIRELRDKVNVAPTSAKYKVYIIDEVHMLTREAFNALLKTLEEPPEHVVFILATTESHKLPETIISRTQRFMFKPVAEEQVVAHLRSIADAEGLEISDEALALVAGYGGGSFRDSISLLDQTRGRDGAVDADFVRSLIGIPTDEAIDALSRALQAHDAAAVTQLLGSMQDQGFAAAQIAKQLSRQVRQAVIARQADAQSFQLLQKLLDVPAAHDPESFLLIVLLEHALAGELPAAPSPSQVAAPPTPAPQAATTPPRQAAVTPPPAAVAKAPDPEPAPEPVTEPEPAPTLGQQITDDGELWPAVLNQLKKTHNTLYGITRMAKPTFYEDGLELAFNFAFHQKRVNEARNKEVITNLLRQLSGREIALHCTLASGAKPSAPPPSSAPSPQAAATVDPAALSAISNVFGSAEVLDK